MESYIPYIWFLMVFIIPLALLVIGIVNYINKVEILEIIIKLFLAFLLYLPTTIFISLFIASLINAMADSKGKALTLGSEIMYFVMILGYGIFGGLLCLFVKGSFTETFSVFYRNTKETQSIFDAD